tara:strand:+ start:896 stop:2470 length:1575 start_codon:yes stop_codon:yes gene_type:complete
MIAGEMGIGKTLSVIEAVENVIGEDIGIYLAPKSALFAVRNEMKKWMYQKRPMLMYTYEKFVIDLKKGEMIVPKVLILDECSKLKNPSTQRVKAVMFLVEKMIEKYGNDCYIVGMTGTPAGKSPADWWSEIECLCPGFLRERDVRSFTERLAIVEENDGEYGGKYPTIVEWRDDDSKCSVCGKIEGDDLHKEYIEDIFGSIDLNPSYHEYKKGINEVANLYNRMKGIVLIINKEDVLDLPDKILQQVRVAPTRHQLELAELLKLYTAGAEAMIRLRCLSDGFQYVDKETGHTAVCKGCNGELELVIGYDGDTPIIGECEACNGTGTHIEVERIGEATAECPKDAYVKAVLDEQSDLGRVVLWGAFKWSIDHLVELCHKEEWATIRLDGRGREARDHLNNFIDEDEVLTSFDNGHPDLAALKRKYPKVAFVGNPAAGGMGITLHAAKLALYYSNTFSGESRIQSMDRIHRIGMDELPATIVDLICLPTDLYILQNLDEKANLENISMNRVREALELDLTNIPLFE